MLQEFVFRLLRLKKHRLDDNTIVDLMDYFVDLNVAGINFWRGRWLNKLFNKRSIHAMTLGRKTVLIHEDVVIHAEEVGNFQLLAHEIVHAKQYAENGYLRFLFLYLVAYLYNLVFVYKLNTYLAYYNIPFEKEAYEFARKVREQYIESKKRG